MQERTVSIASAIQNAYIDFSKMTVSVLALETDVVRDGRHVVGYGFNSNGRYAQGGLLRERFLPRRRNRCWTPRGRTSTRSRSGTP